MTDAGAQVSTTKLSPNLLYYFFLLSKTKEAQSMAVHQTFHPSNTRATQISSSEEDDLLAYASPGPNPDKDEDGSLSFLLRILEFLSEGMSFYHLRIIESPQLWTKCHLCPGGW